MFRHSNIYTKKKISLLSTNSSQHSNHINNSQLNKYKHLKPMGGGGGATSRFVRRPALMHFFERDIFGAGQNGTLKLVKKTRLNTLSGQLVYQIFQNIYSSYNQTVKTTWRKLQPAKTKIL